MTALHSVSKTPAIKEEEEDGDERDGRGVPLGQGTMTTVAGKVMRKAALTQ